MTRFVPVRRRLAAVAAALLVAAAAPAVVAPVPALAASCAGAGGVTVLVDFAELGGGVQAGCDPSIDGRATRSFEDAGFALTMATKEAGFVCRVNGRPASDPCTDAAPADAFWSLWWADGKGGDWVYASRGSGSLRPPEGGYLAFAWSQGRGRAQPPAAIPNSRVTSTTTGAPVPSTAPSAPVKPRPKPTRKPTREPAAKPSRAAKHSTHPTPAVAAVPSPSATEPSATESATTEPSATESGTPTPSPSVTDPTSDTPDEVGSPSSLPDATSITTGPDTGAADNADAADASGEGLPIWVPIGVVALLLGAGGLVAVRRRGA